jgi:hypothetical protein
MALGVRITSNNLNEKTANVTFIPTTGGTVNIGEVTIPFNNITSFPYGTYQIYVPLYDYTYELIINEPTDVKSFVFSTKLINNNNHGFVNLNYDDFTATVFDLGVDYTGWYLNDIYPLTNSGYAFYFQNDNTCNLQWVIFVDSTGQIVENFQTNCNCDYNYDILGGKYAVFSDYYNSILKIFNGKDIYTITADSVSQSVHYWQEWDGVMSNDNIIVGFESKTGSTATLNIFNNGTLIPFGDVYDYNVDDIDVRTYFDGSFIYVSNYDISNNRYSYIKIYDGSTGDLLQNFDLTSGSTYNQQNFTFYGNNKLVHIFWNNSDNNVDYLIVQYDGNTDTLNSITHNRINYPEYPSLYAQQNLYPNNGGSDAFCIIVRDNQGDNGIGAIVSYCDIIYMLSGDTTIQTLTFQNSGVADKTIRTYLVTSNNIFTPCDNGDGKVSVLSITNTGTTYHDTNLLMTSNPSVNEMVDNGNGFVCTFYDDNMYTQMSLIHITENGVLGDVINGITLTGTNQKNDEYIGNLYHFRPYTGNTYYIAPNSDLFQIGTITGNTFYVDYPTSTFKPDFLRRGNIVYTNYNNNECYILTQTGTTSIFNLPTSNEYNIRVGENYFMYVYLDDLSGLTHINVYDFEFNLVNSAVTEFTSLWSTESCNDNFVVIINENNKYYIYLVTENEITYKELSDNNSYNTYNDYVWWD